MSKQQGMKAGGGVLGLVLALIWFINGQPLIGMIFVIMAAGAFGWMAGDSVKGERQPPEQF